jgi:hypothetical protein
LNSNSSIELRFIFFLNEIQIGGPGIENLLVNMMSENKNLKKYTNPKRHLFMSLYFRMG